jgi:hypothetical protein
MYMRGPRTISVIAAPAHSVVLAISDATIRSIFLTIAPSIVLLKAATVAAKGVSIGATNFMTIRGRRMDFMTGMAWRCCSVFEAVVACDLLVCVEQNIYRQ